MPTNPVRAVRKPRQVRRDAEPVWPKMVELIRARLPQRDATIVSELAYAGLRPEEALALIWCDVRPDVLVVERALARGELRGDELRTRHDRAVRLLAPLAADLAEWRLACGRPPRGAFVFPRPDGGPWRDHDWRNWRRRVYQPVARAAGLDSPRPYDLRGSFVSLLIQEGRTVVDVAAQAGHTPETCLRHYARLFRDAPAERVPAELAIRQARAAVRDTAGRGEDASTAGTAERSGRAPRESPANDAKPSAGLEPATPSLPWKCSTN